MKIFVTGATGYIGGAVVEALAKAGHEVTGLVRTPEGEAKVKALGGTPLKGDLKDPSAWARAASGHDAVVHAGFHRGPEGVPTDRAVIERVLEAQREAGGKRLFVYTSGVMVLGHTGGKTADETFPTTGAAQAVAWRPAHEERTLMAGGGDLVTSVLRPGMVYGGKGGHTGTFFTSCKQEGAAVTIGDGTNRWAWIHRADLAQLYRTMIEQRARGMFHGVDGAVTRVAEVARAASEAAGCGGKIRSRSIEEARAQMGLFADASCLDQIVSAPRSLALGWRPLHPPLPGSIREVWREWSGEDPP